MGIVSKEKLLKLVLPTAGYVLALGALAVLAMPAISKVRQHWNADKLPVVEEKSTPKPPSRTVVARTQGAWSKATPAILSQNQSSGISLPRPQEEQESKLDFGPGDSALAQQGYMPILGGQSQSGEERTLTRAERQRLKEKRERDETWAYGTSDDIMEQAEKDVWNRGSSASASQEDEEEETVESIVLKDRKTLVIYQAVYGGDSDSNLNKDENSPDSPQMAGNERRNTSSSRERLEGAAASSSDRNRYAEVETDPKNYQESSPFDTKASVLSFADKPLYADRNLLNTGNSLFESGSGSQSDFLNVIPQSQSNPRANALNSANMRDQRIGDFRAMISSPGGGAAAVAPTDNRAIISSSGSGLAGLNLGAAAAGSPGRLTLPSTTTLPGGGITEALTAPAQSRSLLPESPTRGASPENSSRAIPRMIIRR